MSEHDVDVVVLGGGGSGLAAGARACQLGLQTIVLERSGRIGGTTALAVGSIAAASSTPTANGDAPEAHAADMVAASGDGSIGERQDQDSALRSLYVHNVPATVSWLRSLGVHFFGPVKDEGSSAPRLYNALPHSGVYVSALAGSIRGSGGRIVTNFSVTELLYEHGRVVGVSGLDRDGCSVTYRAHQGVIVATGDFSGNDALKRRYFDGEPFPPVNPGNDGSAFSLAEQVGGQVRSAGTGAWPPELRFSPPGKSSLLRRLPPSRILSAVLEWGVEHVPEGVFRRVVASLGTTYLAPSAQLTEDGVVLLDDDGSSVAWRWGWDNGLSAGKAYHLVFDRNSTAQYSRPDRAVSTAPGVAYVNLPDYQRFRPDLCHECPSAPDVAAVVGAPADQVERQLRGSTPPFVVLGPARPLQILTDGGLEVDTALRVRSRAGGVVPGLYAAGAAGQGSLLLPGHGNHLGWAFTSGRLAAESVCREEEVLS